MAKDRLALAGQFRGDDGRFVGQPGAGASGRKTGYRRGRVARAGRFEASSPPGGFGVATGQPVSVDQQHAIDHGEWFVGFGKRLSGRWRSRGGKGRGGGVSARQERVQRPFSDARFQLRAVNRFGTGELTDLMPAPIAHELRPHRHGPVVCPGGRAADHHSGAGLPEHGVQRRPTHALIIRFQVVQSQGRPVYLHIVI